MSQSKLYRERRNAIAAWLLDRFGPDTEAPYAMFWRDAADLIKFLKSNGLTICPVNEQIRRKK
ncbi:hypothetical protein [Mycobacterium marinum]|uniref:hypothetical protein n=1 Tax=Mycobacterium marinum TaxID=1781 RepID=UPI000B976AB6|nr:hypothetical protein [Mycobacterium marinum]